MYFTLSAGVSGLTVVSSSSKFCRHEYTDNPENYDIAFSRTFNSGHCEFDFMILVDGSTSIGSDNWALVIKMLRTLASVINSNSVLGTSSRVGIHRFPVTRRILSLRDNADLARVNRSISSLAYRGGDTPMFEAVTAAATELSQNVRTIGGRVTATQGIILFTDGSPSDRRDETLEVLQKQMDKGVHVIMIGTHSK